MPNDMLRVIRNHRRAAYGKTDGYEKLSTSIPVPLDHESLNATRRLAKALRRPGTMRDGAR